MEMCIPPDSEETTVVYSCVDIPKKLEPDTDLLESLGFEFMTYDEGKKLRDEDPERFKGKQLEHIVPNSSHVSGTDRHSPPVAGASGYSEGAALIYPIGDDQSPGTEHKFITDYERSVDQMLAANNQYATVEEKAKLMIHGWEMMILKFRGENLAPEIHESARKAAVELAKVYLKHTTEVLEIPRDTPLRNGFITGQAAKMGSESQGEFGE